MQAMILNSGMGSRMGSVTSNKPKCMVEIAEGETLLSHQIDTLAKAGVTEFLMTTGHLAEVLEAYLEDYISEKYKDSIRIRYVHNPRYSATNYIYSMYLAGGFVRGDLLLLHGDLFFGKETVDSMLALGHSSVVIDSTLPPPEKDFSAVVKGDRVKKVATHLSGPDCFACQPLYRLKHEDWMVWADAINRFCASGNTGVYAEEALNTVLDEVHLRPFDVKGALCMEVDTLDDLRRLVRGAAREGDHI